MQNRTGTSKSSIRRHALSKNAVMQCTKCRGLVRPDSLTDPAQSCPKCGSSDWVVYKPESRRA